MGKIKKLETIYKKLDTTEKKAFWIMGTSILLVAVILMYANPFNIEWATTMLFSVSVIAIILVLMSLCRKGIDYNIIYPVLLLVMGLVFLPVAFYIFGGFSSSVSLYFILLSVNCIFCQKKRMRYITFFIIFIGINVLYGSSFFGILRTPFWDIYETRLDSWLNTAGMSLLAFLIISAICADLQNHVMDSELLSDLVDDKVRGHIMEDMNGETLERNGNLKKVTILFADICDFTTITENMEPEETANYLNTFFSIADEKVNASDGIVDKYIGDCIMAYWLDNDSDGTGVIAAVSSAMKIKEELKERAEEIYRQFGAEIDITVGIHYGEVSLGAIGSERRKEYTIIGDVVNTANRIQSQAFKGEILISETVFLMVRNFIRCELSSDQCYLKGKANPVKIYRVNTLKRSALREGVGKFVEDTEGRISIYVCGCRGSYPVPGQRFMEFGGETSCYVIKKDKKAIILDCGSGLMNAKPILADCTDIYILLTHFHYDHIIGFLNISPIPRNAHVRFFAYSGQNSSYKDLHGFFTHPYWPVDLLNWECFNVDLKKEMNLDGLCDVTFYPSTHPDDGCVIKIMMNDKKIVMLGDMEDPYGIDQSVARDADIVLYDGMYDESEKELHKGWGHSTWQDGINYAIKQNVKRLIIVHHNPLNGDTTLLRLENEAKARLSSVVFGRTGDRYEL